MPLRDHFNPPLSRLHSWDALHGGWPATLAMDLNRLLSKSYVASPYICLAVGTDPPEEAYEVRIVETEGQRLLAAIEIVSPANKDSPEHRRAFVAKCAALLQQGVSVSIIDLVTTHRSNLYGDLLDLLGQSDTSLSPAPPTLYAVTCRSHKGDGKNPDWRLETWAYPLSIGEPLPTLPLWLASDLAVPLELEASYEQTCRGLRIE